MHKSVCFPLMINYLAHMHVSSVFLVLVERKGYFDSTTAETNELPVESDISSSTVFIETSSDSAGFRL